MTAARIAPSGEQVELRRDGHHAVIVEVSGGVRLYEVDGHPLLDGYAASEMCSGARGQLLVPWPNRLRDGRYRFAGTDQQVPLTEPENHNAIHGLLRWESWHIEHREDDRVVMTHLLHPRAGYPFMLRMEVDYRLDGDGLVATVTATNAGDLTLPYGMGVHPYLRVDGETVELAWLQGSAATRLLADDRGIPTGRAPVDGTPFDFRERRRVLGTVLDTAFTDLGRDESGRAWVRLWDGRQERGVGLWMDEGYPYYMLFTGDTLPDHARRRRSVAVEPMTCAPNAFATGDGLITLAAGESTTTRWGIVPLGSP